MDKLDPASLLELVLLSEASIDYQVESWLTVSFAIIVASFAARHVLTAKMRWIISSLYVIATCVFVSRWYYNGIDITAFTEALVSQGLESPLPHLTSLSRIILIAFGTFTTLYFVHSSSRDVD